MRKRRRRPRQNKAAEEGGQFFPAVQKKLAVGKPGDAYEVEADNMADRVVNGGENNTVQKQAAPEEEVQQKPLVDTISTVQKKDMATEEEPVQKMEEKEEIQAKEEEPVQKMEEKEEIQAKEEEEGAVQKKEDEESPLQMKEEAEEETVQKQDEEEKIQKKNQCRNNVKASNSEASLKQQKGKGSKMDASTKRQMEQGFGADFSDVTIHTDQAAQELSESFGAQAFTHGNDVYFNEGKYNPNSPEGKHLLAHELTHTIQQKGTKNTAMQAKDKKCQWKKPNRICYFTDRDITNQMTKTYDIPEGYHDISITVRITNLKIPGDWANPHLEIFDSRITQSTKTIPLSPLKGKYVIPFTLLIAGEHSLVIRFPHDSPSDLKATINGDIVMKPN